MRRVQVQVIPGEKPALPVQVVVFQQTSFADVEEAVDALENGCPLVVSVNDEDVASAMRDAIDASDSLELVEVEPPPKVTVEDLAPPPAEPEPDDQP